MLAKKPKRLSTNEFKSIDGEANEKPRYYRRLKWEIPPASPQESLIISQSLMPLEKTAIIDRFTRYLEIHKRHTVDAAKLPLLYADYADSLFGFPEYAVTLGILDILSDRKIVFFPNIGEIRAAIEPHLVEYEEMIEWAEVT